ncbi:hypothetical protein GCM10023171_04690 [Microbacterium panaciterrae]|uniref:Uncharacterized protein n=2 Tax=Microbacterium panaciterrae TaxID=985759 RepID=A0ABP8P3E1_9MICO
MAYQSYDVFAYQSSRDDRYWSTYRVYSHTVQMKLNDVSPDYKRTFVDPAIVTIALVDSSGAQYGSSVTFYKDWGLACDWQTVTWLDGQGMDLRLHITTNFLVNVDCAGCYPDVENANIEILIQCV